VSHRRAYVPRVWPVMLAICSLQAGFAWLARPGVVVIFVSAFAFSWGVTYGRLMVWRRRHPVITVQQVLQDRRDAAPWN
jgi:hypothetical protein